MKSIMTIEEKLEANSTYGKPEARAKLRWKQLRRRMQDALWLGIAGYAITRLSLHRAKAFANALYTVVNLDGKPYQGDIPSAFDTECDCPACVKEREQAPN